MLSSIIGNCIIYWLKRELGTRINPIPNTRLNLIPLNIRYRLIYKYFKVYVTDDV